MLPCVLVICSFAPLGDSTVGHTICLPLLLWTFGCFQFGLSWMKLLWTVLYKSLCGHAFSFFLHKYPGKQFLGQEEMEMFNFRRNYGRFSPRGRSMLHVSRREHCRGSASLPPSEGVSWFSQPRVFVMGSQCDFGLHYLVNERCWAVFHVLINHSWIFLCEVSVQGLAYVRIYWYLYYF